MILSGVRGTLQNLRDVAAELVVQPLLGWLAGKGTQMDGETMDRLALVDLALHPDDPGPQAPGWPEQEWCDGGTCEHPDCLAALEDDGATDGVDPRSGMPLEHTGASVRLQW